MTGIEQLAVIVGSVRKDRVGMAVAQWLLSQVDTQVDLIDLAALDLPADLGGGALRQAKAARPYAA